jgi:hypothetical protein
MDIDIFSWIPPVLVGNRLVYAVGRVCCWVSPLIACYGTAADVPFHYRTYNFLEVNSSVSTVSFIFRRTSSLAVVTPFPYLGWGGGWERDRNVNLNIRIALLQTFRMNGFLGEFAKLRTATISYVMSVRPDGKFRLPVDGFSWNLVFGYFFKLFRNNSMIKIWQEWQVLHMKTFARLWSYLAEFFLKLEIFRTKSVDKIKTHVLCPVTFFRG